MTIISEKSKNIFKTSAYAAVVTGLIAHAFIYTNIAYGRDNSCISVSDVHMDLSGTKWLQFVLYYLTGKQNLPWLSGVISIAAMTVVTYMLIKMFKIKSVVGIWITAGICQTSPSIISSNTYGFSYIFYIALLFSVMGAYFAWNEERFGRKRYILSILSIMASAAMYGSYITVTSTIMLMILIMGILYGKKTVCIIREGIGYLVCLCGGFLSFYVVLRILMVLTSQKIQSYMGEDVLASTKAAARIDHIQQLKAIFLRAFQYYFRYSFTPHILNTVIIIAGAILLIYMFFRNNKEQRISKITLLIFIVVILPISMDMLELLGDTVHYLMYFSFVIPYIMLISMTELFLNDKKDSQRAEQIICSAFSIVLSLMVYYGFVLSNTAYIRWVNYYQETYSLCTRIIDRIETCNGYTGNEDVVLIYNNAAANSYVHTTGIDSIPMLTGLGNPDDNKVNGFSTSTMAGIFENILGFSPDISAYKDMDAYVSEAKPTETEKLELENMKVFPNSKCTDKIGDTIIVVLSE